MLSLRTGGGASLAALLGRLTAGGASVTLCRCDVAAAEEASAVASPADAILHAGGVLRVRSAGGRLGRMSHLEGKLDAAMLCLLFACTTQSVPKILERTEASD